MNGSPKRSETFGRDQRHDEIDAERERDDKTKDGFKHGAGSSSACQQMGVDAHRADQNEAETEIDNVQHGTLLVGVRSLVTRSAVRKGSIGKRMRACKARIKIGTFPLSLAKIAG
jgi:hypothetical protein